MPNKPGPPPEPMVVVSCRNEGCGNSHKIPASDPRADQADQFECGWCRYQRPTFRPLDNPIKTGGPIMADESTPQAPKNTDRRRDKGDEQPSECGCGCGKRVSPRATYAQGHDARHIRDVFYEVVAGKRSRSSGLRQISSTALKQKLRERLDAHDKKQAQNAELES